MTRVRPLWRTGIDALVFLSLLVLVLATLQKFNALEISSNTMVVIDGDSLRDGQTEVRLFGIDAPEYRQMCLDAVGKNFACGKRATQELQTLVEQGDMKCRRLEVDRYGRAVSTCMVDRMDIAQAMVERGWALAFTQFGTDYLATEFLAQKAKRGLWAGSFEPPSDYRKRLQNVQSTLGDADQMEPD